MTIVKDKKDVMQVYEALVKEYEVREETLNGKTYMVVPVTMMVEGVHSGNRGPLLHTADELGKIPESWNGMPVTIGHPMVDGVPVPANSPLVLQDWATGVVFNAKMNGNQLKAEAWLDKVLLQAKNENLYDRVTNGEIIEVSVGVFSEDEEAEGTWHNESYVGVARNLRPEHLAILPNQTGACSVADGCGIRVNNENMKVNEENRLEILQQLKQQGFVVNDLVVNESLLARIELLRGKLREMNSDQMYHYLVDADENFLIYEAEGNNDQGKYFKQGYAIAANNSVTFVGDAVQVVKHTEYKPMPTNNEDVDMVRRRRKINTNVKKEGNMSEGKCSPCVEKKVTALIANAATNFTDNDREWLETLEEGQLDSMVPKAVEPKVIEKEGKITPQMAVNALKEGLKTDEDWLGLMPTNTQEQMRSALGLFEARKETLVSGILANTEQGVWAEEDLKAMKIDQLERIAKTARFTDNAQANYAGMGAGSGTKVQNNGASVIPPMPPAGIEFENN